MSKKKKILYPLEVTTEFVDRCVLQNHKCTKHLKLGWFIMVELNDKGFTIPKHIRQYETERSSSMAFHLHCQQNDISPLLVIEKMTILTGLDLAPMKIEKEN